MSKFISTGIFTQGCIFPITTEDPCLLAILDDFCEEFRINIYAGSSYIDSITIKNYKKVCSELLGFPCYDRLGNYISSIGNLMEEEMYYIYLKIHAK